MKEQHEAQILKQKEAEMREREFEKRRIEDA